MNGRPERKDIYIYKSVRSTIECGGKCGRGETYQQRQCLTVKVKC